MGFLDSIFSPKTKAPGIEAATAALERLRAERAETQAAIAAASDKRRALLRREDSDAEIEALEREVARHELQLERIDEAEPLALAALAGARDRVRAAQLDALRKERFAADREFAEKMRGALEAFNKVIAITDRAICGGFTAEAHSFAVPPRYLTEDAIAIFEREAFRAEAAAAPQPRRVAPVAPVPVAPPPKIEKAASAAPKPVMPAPRVVEPEPTLGPHKLLSSDPGPDADGMTWVWIARGGIQDLPPHRPHRVEYSRGFALVKNGAGEFIEAPEPPRKAS